MCICALLRVRCVYALQLVQYGGLAVPGAAAAGSRARANAKCSDFRAERRRQRSNLRSGMSVLAASALSIECVRSVQVDWLVLHAELDDAGVVEQQEEHAKVAAIEAGDQ